MARKPRGDVVGAIFHVFNRGRRKQPIFLEPQDFRYFLSLVAYAVRRGEIEVLGFVLLSNHFHLVVRSCGGLSEAMRRIENEYARYFNSRYADEGISAAVGSSPSGSPTRTTSAPSFSTAMKTPERPRASWQP